MSSPFWIRLEYRNDVGNVIGFTGSIFSEADLLDVLVQYEITRSNLVTFRVSRKSISVIKIRKHLCQIRNLNERR